ncbi:MAG: hypothetical protein LBH32_05245 [Dysgonamonadaceae bacterium]|nr:hypothetical protein [Dysgonamonadaceae bacterium]
MRKLACIFILSFVLTGISAQQTYVLNSNTSQAPVANMLDVVFNSDGTAIDVSPMRNAIITGETAPTVFRSTEFNRFAARFVGKTTGNNTTCYYKIDYRDNQAIKDAFSNGFSFETLYMPNNDDNVTPLSAQESGGAGIEQATGGNIQFWVHIGGSYKTVRSSVTAVPGTYYHVVGVYDKANEKILVYIDGENAGEQVASGNFGFPSNSSAHWIGVGGDANPNNYAQFPLDGEVVIARMYDKALSAAEALLLYNNRTSGLDNTPRIIPPADMNFGETLAGASSTKTLVVNSISLTGVISAVISEGDGFSIAPATPQPNTNDNYTFLVTFSPTEKRTYKAKVTLSSSGVESVSFYLIGSSDFDLPVQISSEDAYDEHWYYIQFYRRADAGLVWALSDTTRMVIQDTLRVDTDRDDMKWKICGDWENGYYLVNKVGKYGGQEITYCPVDSIIDGSVVSGDRYIIRTGGYGDTFEFLHFGTSSDWQFYNKAAGSYINDKEGKFLCHYNKDDAGNRLVFIVADKPAITATINSVALEAPVNETVLARFAISGLKTTAAISAAVSGADASAFSVSPASLPAAGGELTVTFNPSGVKEYAAVLTLSSAGADNMTVSLSGNSDLGLPEFSTANKEVWYYIQFNRKPTQAWTAENFDEKVMQRDKDENNFSQHWKLVGDWANGYQIVNRNGGAVKYDTISGSATNNYLVLIEEAAFGDMFLFKRQNATAKWQFQSVDKHYGTSTGYTYLNDDKGLNGDGSISLYAVNDSGNLLNFIPADPASIKNFGLDDANGDVIAVKYYTLQGVEVNCPTVTGIYIVKNIHASGKSKVTKKLFLVKQ